MLIEVEFVQCVDSTCSLRLAATSAKSYGSGRPINSINKRVEEVKRMQGEGAEEEGEEDEERGRDKRIHTYIFNNPSSV